MTNQPNLPPGVPPPVLTDTSSTSTETPRGRSSMWDRKIGSLWTETNKKGERYLSGVLMGKDGKEERIFLLKNTMKKNPNAPDWELFYADMTKDGVANDDVL